MTPSLQRIVERLNSLPVLVIDRAWEIVSWNPLGAALVGDPSGWTGGERNIIWRRFAGLPGRVVGDSEEDAILDVEMVADLHDALGRYPEHPELQALIADLQAASGRFSELWQARPARSTQPIARRWSIRRSGASPSTATCSRSTARTCAWSSTRRS